jgi:hypothetical protein
LVVGCLGLAGCGAARSEKNESQVSTAKERRAKFVVAEPIPRPDRIPVPVPWSYLKRLGPRTVRIGGSVGWCVTAPLNGANAPRIERVRSVERQDEIVLHAFVGFRPSQLDGSGACAGVEALVDAVVHLHRRLGSRSVYDGFRQPPIQRWP